MPIKKKNGKNQNGNGALLGIENELWEAADKLRGHLDAAEYKSVVLGLIFLKYVSDIFEQVRERVENEGLDDPEDRDVYLAVRSFWVPKEARWKILQDSAKHESIGNLIDKAMEAIERDNPSLRGMLPGNYGRATLDKRRLGDLVDLVSNKINFADEESRKQDTLGRVYEYFLSQFASQEGRKGGEFYTPRSVVRVLVEMLAPYKGRVFDPCCGSGGMFVQSEKFAEAHGGRIGDISVYGGDTTARNRPSLAQAFEEVSTGAHFIVDVNHLKSKGSACDVPDAMDGQGNCSIVRTNSAITLTNWLASDPTGTGDPDVLIIGDLNSYAMEDPIIAILNAGYENLIFQFGGLNAYSYVFDGQWGYLDHALSTTSLSSQVASVAEWHINSDEPSVLDYNTEYKSAGQITSLYAPDEFRIADHDPVLVDFNLVNDPPTVDAGGPYSGNEGDSITLTATGSDPEGTAVTFTWDLDNNGTYETSGQSVAFAALDGTQDYTVNVMASDAFSVTATASATVHVENVAPVLGAITAPAAPVALGTAANISALFSDAGVLDTHTGLINWGDGSSSAAVVTETNGSGSAAGSHQYAEAGVYRISMTVTDKDGALSNEVVYEYVIVYDPSAGFVTGGGWITSPAGAYALDPTLSGKATFGFVSRYKKGASVPTGNTTFQFHAAGFNFSSTSYEWLVVNQGGTNAQFKGTGTINGEGSYQFMIWASDGNPDTFRIKITATDGSLVYDNGVSQAISGGSIIVHK
jgi:hypothetical protein